MRCTLYVYPCHFCFVPLSRAQFQRISFANICIASDKSLHAIFAHRCNQPHYTDTICCPILHPTQHRHGSHAIIELLRNYPPPLVASHRILNHAKRIVTETQNLFHQV